MTSPFIQLRRRLALAGGRPAAAAADAVHGRRDEAEYRPARLVDPPLRHIAIGEPEPWLDDVGFLDGIQHAELVGYAGTIPIVAAVVRAAVRLRRARTFGLAVAACRRVVVARAAALERLGDLPDGYEPVVVDGDDVSHPIRDVELARALVDRARAALEIEVARDFRAQRDSWLVVDGSLAATPEWGGDARIIGIVKSHAMLPFMGAELETYLTLPQGHRTSLFMPESRRVTPLFAWALRLHPFAGRDLFHGLVRVEAPATDDTLALADAISRRLMAERAPLANDPRADRLLYGIHDVERYLRAQGA